MEYKRRHLLIPILLGAVGGQISRLAHWDRVTDQLVLGGLIVVSLVVVLVVPELRNRRHPRGPRPDRI